MKMLTITLSLFLPIVTANDAIAMHDIGQFFLYQNCKNKNADMYPCEAEEYPKPSFREKTAKKTTYDSPAPITQQPALEPITQ